MSLRHAAARPLVCIALALTGCATAPRTEAPQEEQLVRAVSAPSRLEPPAYLPGEARALLRTRMASHARDMADLTAAIMVLRYPEIEERAKDIANEAHFARPTSDDATLLNAGLPEKFFQYERELRVLASSLGSAAHKLDPFLVANTFGQLSETCVSCHATYRAGRQGGTKNLRRSR
jgi:cytochrome c556